MTSRTRAADPELLERVRAQLATQPGRPSAGRVAAAVRRSGAVLGGEGLLAAAEAVRADLVGGGPLQPLLAEPGTTDVLVNADRGVWVDRGHGLEQVRLDLGGEAGVRALAVRLAAAAGRRLDDAQPFVDARLPGGVRVHAVLPPLAQGGTHLSLRVPARRPMTLDELVGAGSVPPAWAPVLRGLVEVGAAVVVSGGTGAGKTTLLGTLLGLVPAAQRVVVVEDCAELAVDHPHVVRLEARRPNVEGAGGVGLTELVRQALRMRPDRLVVGEVRGPEVRELLTALNTGHEGGCGTLHANSAAEVPARVEALGALAGMTRAAVHAQLRGAVQAVLHLRREGRLRRLVQVGVVTGDGVEVEVRPALVAGPTPGDGERGPGWPALARLLDR